MAAYGGLEYTNELVDPATWKGAESSATTPVALISRVWSLLVSAIKSSQPFDKLPIITLEDGTTIAQSAAIARWVSLRV